MERTGLSEKRDSNIVGIVKDVINDIKKTGDENGLFL